MQNTFNLRILGNTWKKTDGSIARETAGEDTVQSIWFKVPLGSFLEFDLWMRCNYNLLLFL